MELPAATIELLRDEAYAVLCREAFNAKLAELERDKAGVADTRPPFGLLARRETRHAFTRSMQAVTEQQDFVREQLMQLTAIEGRLLPLVREAISEYLAAAAPDYERFGELIARLGDWERSFQGLPELLLGFARDVRAVRLAASAGAGGSGCVHELAVLREMAMRLERHQRELAIVGSAVAEAAVGELAQRIAMPVLPDFNRVAWVGWLAAQGSAQVLAETTAVETAVRQFLAEKAEAALAEIEAAQQACRDAARIYLEAYWEQLRTHARNHYVEQTAADAVLIRLRQHYVEAEVVRRQHEIRFDPLLDRSSR